MPYNLDVLVQVVVKYELSKSGQLELILSGKEANTEQEIVGSVFANRLMKEVNGELVLTCTIAKMTPTHFLIEQYTYGLWYLVSCMSSTLRNVPHQFKTVNEALDHIEKRTKEEIIEVVKDAIERHRIRWKTEVKDNKTIKTLLFQPSEHADWHDFPDYIPEELCNEAVKKLDND